MESNVAKIMFKTPSRDKKIATNSPLHVQGAKKNNFSGLPYGQTVTLMH